MGADVAVLLTTPISFDVVDGPVHCPMVEAAVGGCATKLILDTGSTDHVLTVEVANRAGLESLPGEPGTDHAGESVPSWSIGEVTIEIGSVPLALRDVVAIEGPAPFERWGIGGFLSPQHLHPSAFSIIDLVSDELVLVEGDLGQASEWIDSRHPDLRLLTLPRETGPTPTVQASVGEFASVPTMLNTGTAETEFDRAAVRGLQGTPPDITGLGVSGADVTGEVVADQVLRVGDAALPIPLLFLREQASPEHPPAQIGMDLLRGTVLATSADDRQPVLWLVAR